MNAVLELDIVVYTKPASIQGNSTYKALDKMALSYRVVDISVDADARDYVMSLGYLQAPVVVTQWKVTGSVMKSSDQQPGYPTLNHWSGFRPDRIKELKSEYDRIADRASLLTDEVFLSSLRKLLSV